MTAHTARTSPRLKARIAGFLYLIVIAVSTGALLTNSALIVSGDAAATASNILASEFRFRLSFAAILISNVAYVGVTAMLYGLLKPAGRDLSFLAAFFGLMGCAVGAATSLHLLAPLTLLKGAPVLSSFSPEQLEALALTSLRLSGIGNNISLMFFGFYCLTLGFLVVGSTFLPRIIGAALAVSGLAWLTSSFASFLAPSLAKDLSTYLMAAAALGEITLTLWLLVVGVNVTKWKAQAAVSFGEFGGR